MATLYPIQDALVRGEISPRLHARASLDLYRAGLASCENFLSLPHGGIRKRGATYFAGEVKDSTKAARLIPFIFSSEQAYALEVGHLYIRVYAYGARVGAVEVATPYPESEIWKLQFEQSADQMWIVHPNYAPRILTRTGHTAWSLTEFVFNDGPYLPTNETGTTLTPSDYGALTPIMTSNTTPTGTVNGSVGSNWYLVFDKNPATEFIISGATSGWISYELSAGQAVVDHYYVYATDGANITQTPISWEIEASNDGITWVSLDSRQGESGWSGGEKRYYQFQNQGAYSIWRFRWLGVDGANSTRIPEIVFNKAAVSQTPFNLTASGTAGINDGAGFLASDVGRSIRLRGADNQWRWARIISRISATIVTVVLNGHALPSLSPINQWRMSVFNAGQQADSVAIFEERLSFAKRFSVYASETSNFDSFTVGEEADNALVFQNAGGSQANDIVWIAEADGSLLIATSGGIRSLSGSGVDEALTPSSFKNRRSRTHGCARKRPINTGTSFIYVARSDRALLELSQNNTGRFFSEDIGQISEHIPKRGVVEIAFQSDPDPFVWFPLYNGELGCGTLQPSQEVRGFTRHIFGGTFGGLRAIVESCCVTPNQNGSDDVWLIVKRTIAGVTRRYIEVMQSPFEYDDLSDAFAVDCGLSYSGVAVGALAGLSHLVGQTVDVLVASGQVYRGLVVSGSGTVTLPNGATTTRAHVGLPFTASADTLQLDVGGRDGSLVGRRRKVQAVIISLLETDISGLKVSSLIRGKWEPAKLPSNTPSAGVANLFTGELKVLIDDSWEGRGQVRIRHDNPTPCTIRSITPVFDMEP
jgi:hypothetical protein